MTTVNSEMTDISYTQCTRHMSSTPLNRARGGFRDWSEVVSDHNKLPIVITDRKNGQRVKQRQVIVSENV